MKLVTDNKNYFVFVDGKFFECTEGILCGLDVIIKTDQEVEEEYLFACHNVKGYVPLTDSIFAKESTIPVNFNLI